MIEVIFGQILDAVFFSFFMIYIKGITNKKALFTFYMIVLYLLLKVIFQYDLMFQFLYIFGVSMLMKKMYKEKSQIIDLFLFVIASVIVIVSSIIAYRMMLLSINNMFIGNILAKLLSVAFTIIFDTKIRALYTLVLKNWNRRKGNKYRSLSVRNVCLIVFNLMLFVIGLWLILRLDILY